ncbi:MAG TPA: hypothetical protein VMW18_20950 [Candidatus Binatia bacterium]|nr:hypothetical protein [Candidatus Binatia bacterium]
MNERKAERLTNRVSDIVVWALTSGLVLACGYGLAVALTNAVGFFVFFPLVAVLVIPVVLGLFVGGPIAIAIVGLRKRRLAMVVGPAMLVPIFLGVSIASNWFDFQHASAAVAALDKRQFAPANGLHRLVFMEFARSPDCDGICQQILLHTNYNVGIDGAPRVLYRKVSESECSTTDLTTLHFSGVCVTREVSTQAIDDGLIVETPGTYVPGGQSGVGEWDVFGRLPMPEFTGDAFAVVERVPGVEDRLLGMWVSGKVAVWPFHSGPIGKSFSRGEFYAAALGLPIQE